MDSTTTVMPNAILGVLGGGQLGKYFTSAAHELGYRVWVLDPDPKSPAGRIADYHCVAGYEDQTALAHFAAHCAAITTEFENVAAQSLRYLAEHTRVSPRAEAVAICQQRIREKDFLKQHGLPHAPYVALQTSADLAGATPDHFPAILKTAQNGYDGKGQLLINSPAELAAGWQHFNQQPAVLEKKLAIDAEISVIVARAFDGQAQTYPAVHNQHRHGILDMSTMPVDSAICPPSLQQQAVQHALYIAERLNYVGVLAVEFFVAQQQLYVNELAPRPHNSGHVTLDNGCCSQFEQQVRILCGLPLGQTQPQLAAVMVNCLGDLWAYTEQTPTQSTQPTTQSVTPLPIQAPNWSALLAYPNLLLHLYGKETPRPGRKMGHFTLTGPSVEGLMKDVQAARALLGIKD